MYKWGTTTANCTDCKKQLNKEKVKQDCQRKKNEYKQIRLLVGKVKVEKVYILNVLKIHIHVTHLQNKICCKSLDGLTHSPGDKQRCEIYKSIKQCFQNIISINNREINPLSLSIWQIADYLEDDPLPTLIIPKDLQISIPETITTTTPTNLSINPSQSQSQTKENDYNKNHNISKTDDDLYEFDESISTSPTMIEQIIESTNTNNKQDNSTNTIQIPIMPSLILNENHQSEDDVDMIRPRKPKPKTDADTSRSRSRSRNPRSKTSLKSKRTKNKNKK